MIQSIFADASSLKAELRAAVGSLVENEDVLRAVLSGCGDCIKILDLDGHLLFMSQAGRRVMEVDDFSVLKGCAWPDLWTGEGSVHARNGIEKARRGETAHFKGLAETAKGNIRYWDVQISPIWGSEGITQLLSISRDITTEWKAGLEAKEAVARQQLLVAKMNHRINNSMALISAMAFQTFRGPELSSARDAFMARLSNLAEANKILLNAECASAPMEEVVRRALAPHVPAASRFQVNGPNLNLTSKQAMSLSLAVHELATNAVKYGSLSNSSGKVSITWDFDRQGPDALFRFNWSQTGGPPISSKPSRKGFGSRILRVFAQDFGGQIESNYRTAGFSLELRSPRERVA